MAYSNIKATPMMRQYLEIKKEHPDKIVFFRLGDFYEMFIEDAVEAAKILQLALTKRQDMPMCGVPHHAAKNYIYKLINAGKKVVLAEQMELPGQTKGIVKREVTQIFTPGTILDPEALEQSANNFIMGVTWSEEQKIACAANIDLSTGDGEIFSKRYEYGLDQAVRTLIERYNPREILIADNIPLSFRENLENTYQKMINQVPAFCMLKDYAERKIKDVYHLQSLKVLQNEHSDFAFAALAAILYYIEENHHHHFEHLKLPAVFNHSSTMMLDAASIYHLDLVKNTQSQTTKGSLFEVLNRTATGMGARKLKRYILTPLMDLKKITGRHDTVEFLFDRPDLLTKIKADFKHIYDFERLLSRIATNRILPKELITLKNSLMGCQNLIRTLENHQFEDIQFPHRESIAQIIEKLHSTLREDPHNNLQEGGYIRAEVNVELQKFTQASDKGVDWLLKLLEEEKKLTGISNLKIKHTDNAGYFFEVTKANAKRVPEHFVKKQSMLNAERFVTEKLLERQSFLVDAKTKLIELEQTIYQQLKTFLKEQIKMLQGLADFCSEMDVYTALATTALENRFVRPVIVEEPLFEVSQGRHPVIENLSANAFIPNDLTMNESQFIHIITGPNMAGKSTFLRQAALISLLAQIGSFVPAKSAKIGICDQIFTRIGAADNLVEGESTFLVEMSETAYILSHATRRSLIIMDEIGRGTSTYDGLSLAWSILEYLSEKENLRPRTLFATHYHEITALGGKNGLVNYSVSVDDTGDQLIFLKKVVEGAADDSYGIRVAQMAGLPQEVIEQANVKLSQLESQSSSQATPAALKTKKSNPRVDAMEKILFEIKQLDLNSTSPMEAMIFLESIKNKLSGLK